MDEHEIREVPTDTAVPGGERVEESAADIANYVSAASSVLGFGVALRGLHHQSLQTQMMRADHERQRAEADHEQDLRALDLEYRLRTAQVFGLEGLDAIDSGDEYYPGFSPDHEFRGFGVED